MDATRDVLARRPSLVVLDLNPPHIGGEVGDGISARHGRAVPIAMVGASREVAEMGGELDAAFLAKPVNVDELSTVVCRCLVRT